MNHLLSTFASLVYMHSSKQPLFRDFKVKDFPPLFWGNVRHDRFLIFLGARDTERARARREGATGWLCERGRARARLWGGLTPEQTQGRNRRPSLSLTHIHTPKSAGQIHAQGMWNTLLFKCVFDLAYFWREVDFVCGGYMILVAAEASSSLNMPAVSVLASEVILSPI